ncbi:hypothetical protein CEE35_08825 [Candidatus Aerophobetes bacterium Ae_b3b]|nr:MAG: hypothetical protein CEE35_08825 [Candidatus Aerophobetes bacterium Ae_b3b]
MERVYLSFSLGIFLALSSKKDSFNKVNSKGIGNASALPILFLYYFAKELMGISGTRQRSSADNLVP